MKLLGTKETLHTSCMIHHETTDVEMIAHVDDLFVVGWLKHTQDVYRGLADAVEMKCTYAGPKTGKPVTSNALGGRAENSWRPQARRHRAEGDRSGEV